MLYIERQVEYYKQTFLNENGELNHRALSRKNLEGFSFLYAFLTGKMVIFSIKMNRDRVMNCYPDLRTHLSHLEGLEKIDILEMIDNLIAHYLRPSGQYISIAGTDKEMNALLLRVHNYMFKKTNGANCCGSKMSQHITQIKRIRNHYV